MEWYAQINAAFDKARGLNDIGRILEQEAARGHFQQAILVMKSSVPFSRPSFYLITGESPPTHHQGGDGRLTALDGIASRSAASADVIIWTKAINAEDSFRSDGPGSELEVHGITYAVMGADSTLYSISYTRNGPAVTEAERGAAAWRFRYLNDLVRRYCDALNLFERGASALTEREIEILRWTADGKGTNDVAAILRISENTINYHLKKISRKMNCNTKLQAATYAVAINLI